MVNNPKVHIIPPVSPKRDKAGIPLKLKICNALNCDVGDIMEFVRDDSDKPIEENE